MYARVTQLEIDTLRTSVDEALELFRANVLPSLREQPGYCGVYVMSTPEGQAVLVSLWATKDAAAEMNSGGWYSTVLGDFGTLFRSPPGRSYYEVLVAETPAAVT